MVRMRLVDFPAAVQLDQWQPVRPIPVDLVGRHEDEHRLGQYRRAASNSISVPLALTVKSVTGSRAAQSCDGCAAV